MNIWPIKYILDVYFTENAQVTRVGTNNPQILIRPYNYFPGNISNKYFHKDVAWKIHFDRPFHLFFDHLLSCNYLCLSTPLIGVLLNEGDCLLLVSGACCRCLIINNTSYHIPASSGIRTWDLRYSL